MTQKNLQAVPKSGENGARLALLRFGNFTLDLERHGLYDGDRRVRLTSKPFETLVVLVEHRGQTIQKQQLLDAVWKDAFVTEDSLVKAVREIRRALDDEKTNPRFIQTVSGEGYRFIAQVTIVEPLPENLLPLEHPEQGTTDAPVPAGLPRTNQKANRRFWLLAAGVVIFAALVGGILLWPPRAPESLRQTPIASFSSPYTSISASADGNSIAFVAELDGVPQVWIKNLSGGEPYPITSGKIPASHARWSPKNNEIVFNRGEQAQSIWSVPPSPGHGPTLLIEGGRNPNWSLDGDRLVFEKRDEIWTADADGTNQRKVEGVPDVDLLIVDREPALAPDGSQIVFFQPEDGPMGDIWVIPSKGGAARQLTFDNHFGGSPVWSPDGDYIVFQSQRGGSKTLWKIPSSGGTPEPIFEGPGEQTNPEITRDASRLIYASTQKQWILTLKEDTSAMARELRKSATDMFFPTFSPQRDRIAFFATVAGGDIELFTVRADGSQLTQVTRGKGERNVFPTWSTDGTSLYFYQIRPTLSFRRIAATGGASIEIASGWRWRTHNAANVDSRGQFIVYSKILKGKTVATLIRDIQTGSEKALAHVLDNPQWSNDGNAILGVDVKSGVDGSPDAIVICTLQESCRKIANGSNPIWSRDNSNVYFERWKTSTDKEIWVSSRVEGEKRITELRLDPLSSFHDVSSTGQLTYVQIKHGEQELWMTNFK